MTWDRWLGVFASVGGIALVVGQTFGPVVVFLGLGTVLFGIVVARLHVGYGRPFHWPHYTPPVLSREEWGIRMGRAFQAQYPALFPAIQTTQERQRRASWRREPSLAVPRRNEGHKTRSGWRKAERRRAVRVPGCLPHIMVRFQSPGAGRTTGAKIRTLKIYD